MDHSHFTYPVKSVEVLSDGEHWSVRVVDGNTEHVIPFQLQYHAEAFADGQRARLGLEFPLRVDGTSTVTGNYGADEPKAP